MGILIPLALMTTALIIMILFYATLKGLRNFFDNLRERLFIFSSETLYACIESEDRENLTRILERKPSLIKQEYCVTTPLFYAIEKGAGNAIMLTLLARGASPNGPNKHGSTPLHYAVIHNKPGNARILLCNGAKPYLLNAENLTPYELAEQTGRDEIACLLAGQDQ